MFRVLTLVAVLIAGAAHAAPWSLLPGTAVSIDIPWRGLAVELRFPDIAGSIDFDEQHPEKASARIEVAAASAETGLPPANRVARSADFLAADRYPTIAFTLDRLVQTSPSTANVSGRITFRGVTRPIAFAATVTRYGPAEGDPDRFEAGFRLEGSIDRTEFGSTGALSDVPAVLPIRIRLLMASRPPR